MYIFSQAALKLLNEYRSLVRKQGAEGVQKLDCLSLNKKISGNDQELYQLILQILKYEQNENISLQSGLRYSGLNRFVNHLSEFIHSYRLVKGKVIHPGQAASRAVIEAVQLMSLAEDKLDASVASKLENCIWLLAKFGSDVQKNALLNALKSDAKRCAHFFQPHLNQYKYYLDVEESSANSEEKEKIAC